MKRTDPKTIPRDATIDPWAILDEEPEWVILVAKEPGFQPELLSPEARARLETAARKLPERPGGVIRRAIEELLLLPDPRRALQWLCEVGVWEAVLPELQATVSLSQEAGRRHKDVWEHTKQVVYQAPVRPILRWAALLHDIGKAETRTIGQDGKVHFLGHAEKGARMFRRIARRLDFPRKDARKIAFLILKHLRANQYEGQWTDSAVRRFYREVGDALDDLLDLSRADITTARPSRRRRAHEHLDELLARIQRLKEEDARVPPLPKGLGNHIMKAFDLAPGPAVGALRSFLEAAVERGELEPQREPEYYLAFLRETRPQWEPNLPPARRRPADAGGQRPG